MRGTVIRPRECIGGRDITLLIISCLQYDSPSLSLSPFPPSVQRNVSPSPITSADFSDIPNIFPPTIVARNMIRREFGRRLAVQFLGKLADQQDGDDDQDDDGVSYTCQIVGQINSRGIWFGDDPFAFSVPLLMMQLSLISIFTRSLYCLLKPFGQPSIVSHILVSFRVFPLLSSHPGFYLLLAS